MERSRELMRAASESMPSQFTAQGEKAKGPQRVSVAGPCSCPSWDRTRTLLIQSPYLGQRQQPHFAEFHRGNRASAPDSRMVETAVWREKLT